MTKDSIAALVEGIYFDNSGNITNINTSGLVTTDDFNVLLSKKITFDAEGHVSNISTSGLVTETSFTHLFSEQAAADGYVKKSYIDLFVTENENGTFQSNAIVSADNIDFKGGAIKISAENIDFEGADFKLSADNINFEGTTVKITADNISLESYESTGGGFSIINGELIINKGTIGGFEIGEAGSLLCEGPSQLHFSNGVLDTLIAPGKIDLTRSTVGTAFNISGFGYNFSLGDTGLELNARSIKIIADDSCNMPGVLGIYEVNFQTGNYRNCLYGRDLLRGNPYKINNSEMVFPHNLGHKNYTVIANCWGKQIDNNINPFVGNLSDHTENSFTLYFFRTGDADRMYPAIAHIVILGKNIT